MTQAKQSVLGREMSTKSDHPMTTLICVLCARLWCLHARNNHLSEHITLKTVAFIVALAHAQAQGHSSIWYGISDQLDGATQLYSDHLPVSQ